MLRLIYTICVGLFFLSSCEVELPPRFPVECDLLVNERRNEIFRTPYRVTNDSLPFFVEGNNGNMFIIAKKEVNPDGFDVFSFTIKPAHSASQLFLLGKRDDIVCASRVHKGDTLNLGFLQKSGLYESGIRWCNDCEVLLSSQTKPKVLCGPEHFEIFKMPISIGVGNAATFGWIEFKVGPNSLAIVKTGLAHRCEQTVVQ